MDAIAWPPSTADEILTRLAQRLHELVALQDDAASWEKATVYIEGYDDLKRQPEYEKFRGQKQSREIHNALRLRASDLKTMLPRPSFLSNARKLADTWPEIFTSGSKVLPYQHYSQIAVCSLPAEDRNRLRAWAEAVKPQREELRQRIREEVDIYNGIHRPDFELKVSNFWKFNSHHPNGAYGGVHDLIYANLLHWYSEPGDTVLDPMAGTGILGQTLEKYRFFRQDHEAEGAGVRFALMSDLVPTSPEIVQTDATVSLPFDDGVAALAILDPPYFRVADEKNYTNLGRDFDTWIDGLRLVLGNVKRCLRPGGIVAVMTDDVLRSKEHTPIAYKITQVLDEVGFVPKATIYNHNPNFVYTMGPAMMKHTKAAKLLCNGCKVIQLATKPGSSSSPTAAVYNVDGA